MIAETVETRTQENTGQKTNARPQYHDATTRSHQGVYSRIIQHSMHSTPTHSMHPTSFMTYRPPWPATRDDAHHSADAALCWPPPSPPVAALKSVPTPPTPTRLPAPNLKSMMPEERTAFIHADMQRHVQERLRTRKEALKKEHDAHVAHLRELEEQEREQQLQEEQYQARRQASLDAKASVTHGPAPPLPSSDIPRPHPRTLPPHVPPGQCNAPRCVLCIPHGPQPLPTRIPAPIYTPQCRLMRTASRPLHHGDDSRSPPTMTPAHVPPGQPDVPRRVLHALDRLPMPRFHSPQPQPRAYAHAPPNLFRRILAPPSHPTAMRWTPNDTPRPVPCPATLSDVPRPPMAPQADAQMCPGPFSRNPASLMRHCHYRRIPHVPLMHQPQRRPHACELTTRDTPRPFSMCRIPHRRIPTRSDLYDDSPTCPSPPGSIPTPFDRPPPILDVSHPFPTHPRHAAHIWAFLNSSSTLMHKDMHLLKNGGIWSGTPGIRNSIGRLSSNVS